ncbi:hypothetical protein [Chryseobacterium jejuense]|uniref:Uncharacterized protein n=1 Tax=Chryseobacterium jejuense TaxID=445960 RepID=A0A2X2X5D0_CHRJE|nr:hypothetical protein [Chryseobacterium jejuense]SDJ65332.1 hypothetical protein SAMN05421542_4036 [Chryseobacterium jejuense]SQB43255.1 Uncharacterised protein [Chryseobacterium jejuense]
MGKYFLYFSCIIILFILSSCKNRNLNYITYYNQVNNIDSIYRFKKDTRATVKQYKKLFRRYPPLNQDRIEEYETYIKLSDQQHKNFGGKKSLRKLILLVAPYWQYKKEDSTLMHLFQKNGITPQEMEQDVAEWKSKNNRKLIDSFSIAFKRDQESRKNNLDIIINDRKNAEMLKWMFENEGFPSIQKIGLWNNNLFMPVGPLLLHMANYDEYHQYFKTKILEYVKSGECPPRDYAAMIDRYNLYVLKKDPIYYIYVGQSSVKDSTAINRNRKSIGLPSMKHGNAIIKDYYKKNKVEK